VFVEKRKYPRISFNVDVQYEVISKSNKKNKKDHSKNLSASGICIIALEELNIGAQLQLQFSSPNNNKIITALGEVIWTKPYYVDTNKAYDVGVEFVNIAKDDKDEIDQYVLQVINKASNNLPH
jgi:c-di-GMP-binding flagellar brake protein YcgR